MHRLPESLTNSPDAFSRAVDSKSTVRFIKVVISNETLVPAATIPPSGTFQQDLDKLVDVLEDSIPAYILARTDKPGSEWLAIFYVPETSKIRDKVSLYNTLESGTLIGTNSRCSMRLPETLSPNHSVRPTSQIAFSQPLRMM